MGGKSGMLLARKGQPKTMMGMVGPRQEIQGIRLLPILTRADISHSFQQCSCGSPSHWFVCHAYQPMVVMRGLPSSGEGRIPLSALTLP